MGEYRQKPEQQLAETKEQSHQDHAGDSRSTTLTIQLIRTVSNKFPNRYPPKFDTDSLRAINTRELEYSPSSWREWPQRSFRSGLQQACGPFLRRQMETVLLEKPIYSRRFSTRIELLDLVCVYWNCAGKDDLSAIRNLSIGGLFLTTPKPRSLGATAKVDFLVPDGQIRAEAVIRHVIPKMGLGLKFTALLKEDRPHLAALMAKLRSCSRVRLDSDNSQLTENSGTVIDLMDELPFENFGGTKL